MAPVNSKLPAFVGGPLGNARRRAPAPVNFAVSNFVGLWMSDDDDRETKWECLVRLASRNDITAVCEAHVLPAEFPALEELARKRGFRVFLAFRSLSLSPRLPGEENFCA